MQKTTNAKIQVSGVRYDATLHKTFGDVDATVNGLEFPTINMYVSGYVSEDGFRAYATAQVELMDVRGDFD